MKKSTILFTALFLANTAYAKPQQIPSEFHGKWVQAGESCEEYNNGETVRWWDINQNQINQYRFGCQLDKVILVKPHQFRAKWRCDETDDDGETQKSTPSETLTLSADGKRLTAFKQSYRFCGKHQSKDEFVCRGNKTNIAVSSYGNTYYYTAWSKSRATPDLFLQNGDVRIDGTGRYLHSVYTFTRPNGWQYEVREGGLHTAEPDHIKGWVTITRHGKTVSEMVCK